VIAALQPRSRGTGLQSVGARRDGRRRQADKTSNEFAARRSETRMNAGAPIHCVILATAAICAVPAFADDGARISRLESEIQQLRTQVDAQNRRIQKLEADLARRTGAKPPGDKPPRAGDGAVGRPAPAGPQPWHADAAWSRVAKGMTAAEVTTILGTPTAAESVDGFKTLFYRGATPAGADLRGIVNLRDDRVVAVVKPAF
jgi:hypothetical protein